MGFGSCVECGNRMPCAGIWPMRSTLPHILQAFRQVSVNQAFRGKLDFAVLHSSLQKVAYFHMHLFANMLRNHNLKLVFTVTIFI